MRHRQLMPIGVLAAALLATACGQSGGGGQSPTSAPAGGAAAATGGTAVVKSDRTAIGTVLANSRGRTLYWFAIDTPTSSKCVGACLSAWPVVAGTPKPASGVSLPGTFGTLKRADGITQATWNGHPLYLYSGDTGPGQTTGDGITGFGGLWHAVVLSGGGSSSPSPSSGSRGYGGGGY